MKIGMQKFLTFPGIRVKISFLARDQARVIFFCKTLHYDHFNVFP